MGDSYLIIGATSGIGRAILDKLIADGHRVVQLSRHPEQAPDHPRVTSVGWDAGTGTFPIDCLPETLQGLVYCPGSIRLKPFGRLKESEWTADFEINVMGAVRAIQAALPRLQQAERSSIVLFSTVAVQVGMPFHASVASAKGAIEGLARSLAAELAPRIRVNVVAPTLTDTPLAERLLNSADKRKSAAERHPLKSVARPEEIAHTAVWLLRDAPLVTGQVVACDGGLASIRML